MLLYDDENKKLSILKEIDKYELIEKNYNKFMTATKCNDIIRSLNVKPLMKWDEQTLPNELLYISFRSKGSRHTKLVRFKDLSKEEIDNIDYSYRLII